MKPDFYTLIHKAIRRRLYLLSIDLGTTDNLEILKPELNNLFDLLRLHAEHETTYFHPVIKRYLPELAKVLDKEHAEQEALLANILAHPEPYFIFNNFIADYLKHLDEEEAIMKKLWECCPDEELNMALGQLLSSFSPEYLKESLAYMLPALNTQERKALTG